MRVWVRVSRNFVDLINQFVPVRNLTRKLESHVNKRGPPGFLGWPIKPSEVYVHTRYRSTGESEIALTSLSQLLEIRFGEKLLRFRLQRLWQIPNSFNVLPYRYIELFFFFTYFYSIGHFFFFLIKKYSTNYSTFFFHENL